MECLELFSRKESDFLFDVWGNEVPQDFQEATNKQAKEVFLTFEDSTGKQQDLKELTYDELKVSIEGEGNEVQESFEDNIVRLDGFETLAIEANKVYFEL